MRHKVYILALLLLLSAVGTSFAAEGQETYFYDPAGRIVRILAPDDAVTYFAYDALGNLVSVRVDPAAKPPLISEVSPTELRAGGTYSMLAKGENLSGVDILPPTSDFSISDLIVQPDSLAFVLALSEQAPLGEQVLRVSNPDGSTSIRISVLPRLPRLSAAPLPLALPEDGSVREILVRLSHADVVDREVALSTADPAIAELLDTTVTIPAGDTEARVRIRGASGGVTRLTLDGQGLESAVYSVYVTAAYGDINTKFSNPLGVVVGDLGDPAAESKYARRSQQLGVSLGSLVSEIVPSTLSVGAAAVSVTVAGIGLQGVDGVSAIPPAGLSIGSLDVRPDGTAVTFLVSVEPDAPYGPRRMVLTGDGPDYPPATPGADVLDIAAPPPQIESIDPVFALPGDTASSMLIRGRFLDRPLALQFEPAQGLVTGTDLRAEADGTRLYARFSVAADTLPGERIVRVATPAGTSSAAPSAANRFRVVNRVVQTHTPIAAPTLGITVGPGAPPSQVRAAEVVDVLGVSLGPVVTEMSPQLGKVGTSLELELRGTGLAGVSDLSVEPPEGVTLGVVATEPLGEFIRLTLLISPDAPQVWRRVRLFAAGIEVPFAAASTSRFLVTAPLPRVFAVNPNTLQIGSGDRTFRLWGESFSRATQVSAEPPNGLAIGLPGLTEDGTALTVAIRADRDASPGPRVLRVTTPTGTSTPVAGPQNTLTLFDEARASPKPLVSPLLGVTLGTMPDEPSTLYDLPAALIGIQVGTGDSAPDPSFLASAPALGLAVGPIVTAIEAPPLALGGSYELRVVGRDLHGVDGAGIFPGFDVAVGSPFPSDDGTEVALTLTVSPDAELQPRELRLVAGPDIVAFADPADAVLRLGTGIPRIDSIQPIVAQPGDTFELVVRGNRYRGTIRVLAEPGEGFVFDTKHTVNAEGTELRIRMHVSPGASIGPRTIRVETPSGTSTDAASPANTFTVY